MKHLLIFLCLLQLAAFTANAADRVALVVGVNTYQAFPQDKQLTSPTADATDVATILRGIGFVVQEPVLNGTRDSIVKAKQRFMEEAKGAQIAVFYFSGHGFQVGDENYLIPADMPRITSFTVLRENAIQLRDSVMSGMEEAGAGTKVIILDCCRDNPFASQISAALGTKSLRTKGGSGEISGYGPGFFLAFASSPGATALDGNGARNSPFTAALLTHLRDKAGLNIRELFDEVKSTVQDKNGAEQVPWVNDSLNRDHVKVLARLVPTAPTAPSVAPKPPDTAPAMSEAEIERRARELAARMAANSPNTSASTIPANPSISASELYQGAVGKVIQVKLPGDVLMKFAFCPPGSFTMGSPAGEEGRGKDEDQVQVRVSKGFWMGQTEVTQGQWKALMGSNPSEFKGDDLPVEKVSWNEAQEFIQKLNQSVTVPAGWQYALPTEAQWEYACRAGTESVYSFGDNASQLHLHGNFADKNFTMLNWSDKNQDDGVGNTTAKVGSYRANKWGLYDMHGNVWEWCADWYGEKLVGGSDPTGATTGAYRVHRGGSWYYDAAAAARPTGAALSQATAATTWASAPP